MYPGTNEKGKITVYSVQAAERMKTISGQKYRPVTGNEVDIFSELFCDKCLNSYGCGIVIRTYLPIDDPGYPAEWQIETDGQPVCTAFQESEA